MKLFSLASTGSLVIAVLIVFPSNAFAQSINLSPSERAVTAAEAADGAPAGGTVFEFFATTDSDILAINFVTTFADAPFFQQAFGDVNNSAPGNPALIPTFPSLGADSWITTPGGTNVLGGGFPADGNDTWGDTDDDGPQAGFQFAQLTLPAGAAGTFSGQFDIANGTEVFSQNFSFALGIPEPATLALAGLGLIGLLSARRRRS